MLIKLNGTMVHWVCETETQTFFIVIVQQSLLRCIIKKN